MAQPQALPSETGHRWALRGAIAILFGVILAAIGPVAGLLSLAMGRTVGHGAPDLPGG